MSLLGIIASSKLSSFNPSNISNLYLWLDADDASTFTYSSGVSVSQWNDKSGNGYHATQATVAKQPSRITSPSISVDYDGSNDVLSTTASFNGAAFTIFSVVREFDTTPGGGDVLIGGGSGGTQIYFPYFSVGDYYFQTISSWGQVAVTQPSGLYEIEVRYNGAGSTNADKMKGRIGGSDRTLSFTGTIESTLSRSGETTAIGAYNFTPILPFHGAISEIIAYDKVLSATELTQVRDYLSAKWSITA
jgi:hypothetical protein